MHFLILPSVLSLQLQDKVLPFPGKSALVVSNWCSHVCFCLFLHTIAIVLYRHDYLTCGSPLDSFLHSFFPFITFLPFILLCLLFPSSRISSHFVWGDAGHLADSSSIPNIAHGPLSTSWYDQKPKIKPFVLSRPSASSWAWSSYVVFCIEFGLIFPLLCDNFELYPRHTSYI